MPVVKQSTRENHLYRNALRHLLLAISLWAPYAYTAGEHETRIFHALVLETALGSQSSHHSIVEWDLDGWIGGDDHKLWLKIEGERQNGVTETAEFWAMYSRNISTFWDAQGGIRHDAQAASLDHIVLGFNGLAPYFFETQAHIFISEKGDISARLRQENEFLLTQSLILEPYLEFNVFAQDVPEIAVGQGLSEAELGVQIRHQFIRKFALYVDIRHQRKFGETASIARRNQETVSFWAGLIGMRILF